MDILRLCNHRFSLISKTRGGGVNLLFTPLELNFWWILGILRVPPFLKRAYSLDNLIYNSIYLEVSKSLSSLREDRKELPKNSIKLLRKLFVLLFSANWVGIYPYSPKVSCHFLLNFTLRLWFCIGYFFLGNLYNHKKVLNHLIPPSTPGPLIWLILMIEFLRKRIRPFTLATRITANITSGHILLNILFGADFFWNVIAFIGSLYYTIELIVCFLQSFVFVILLSSYSREN